MVEPFPLKIVYFQVMISGAFYSLVSEFLCTTGLKKNLKWHQYKKTEEFINTLKANNEVETLNIGSSLKFCLVAEGEAHVYPRFGPTMEWDTCAPQIIAEESGANVFVANNMSALKYNKQNLLNPFFIVAAKTFNPNN